LSEILHNICKLNTKLRQKQTNQNTPQKPNKAKHKKSEMYYLDKQNIKKIKLDEGAVQGSYHRQWVVPPWAVLPLSSKTQKHPTYQPEWRRARKKKKRGKVRRDKYPEERG